MTVRTPRPQPLTERITIACGYDDGTVITCQHDDETLRLIRARFYASSLFRRIADEAWVEVEARRAAADKTPAASARMAAIG